ncbi:unnamed protein product, partial [Amoebophrya sp. A25]
KSRSPTENEKRSPRDSTWARSFIYPLNQSPTHDSFLAY